VSHVLHIPFVEQLIKEPFVNTFKAKIDSECASSLTDELKELSQIIIKINGCKHNFVIIFIKKQTTFNNKKASFIVLKIKSITKIHSRTSICNSLKSKKLKELLHIGNDQNSSNVHRIQSVFATNKIKKLNTL
jgi:hypothetical protein